MSMKIDKNFFYDKVSIEVFLLYANNNFPSGH